MLNSAIKQAKSLYYIKNLSNLAEMWNWLGVNEVVGGIDVKSFHDADGLQMTKKDMVNYFNEYFVIPNLVSKSNSMFADCNCLHLVANFSSFFFLPASISQTEKLLKELYSKTNSIYDVPLPVLKDIWFTISEILTFFNNLCIGNRKLPKNL